MAATRQEISEWFDEAIDMGATHLIIACDSFEPPSSCCYPKYVMPDENARERAKSADRIMECYSMALPKEEQMAERRANHWD